MATPSWHSGMTAERRTSWRIADGEPPEVTLARECIEKILAADGVRYDPVKHRERYMGLRAEQHFASVTAREWRGIVEGRDDGGRDFDLGDGRGLGIKGTEYDSLWVAKWELNKPERADAYCRVEYRNVWTGPGEVTEAFRVPALCWAWREDFALGEEKTIKRTKGRELPASALRPADLLAKLL